MLFRSLTERVYVEPLAALSLHNLCYIYQSGFISGGGGEGVLSPPSGIDLPPLAIGFPYI